MELLSFRATECGSKVEYGTIICGASNSKSNDESHTFIFMRSENPKDPDDDGPYFELDTQSQGAYNIVKALIRDGDSLSIELDQRRDMVIAYNRIQVDLGKCTKREKEKFFESLEKIFIDNKNIWVTNT